MKRTGILNAGLSRLVAAMGHTDRLVVCDSGLPIPRSAETIDIALTRNVPRFVETLSVILSEAVVESVIIADEMKAANHGLFDELSVMLKGIPIRSVPHEEFKRITREGEGNTAFVRTGESTPYANVILIAGVAFD
ncbi:MAG: D-ribose pyranase [Bacteroidetes bacterium]|nr:D-ribose pyranase [Bacteroidota bacterium]